MIRKAVKDSDLRLYRPIPDHKFSFGLWTLGNRGRDPFGEAVRPTISPVDIVSMLAEVGAWIDRGYAFKFALEAKPNEPGADIYMATTGHYLGFIPTLEHPDVVGVNPKVAHEQMAGLSFMHGVAQAWEAGKLFHIDLNDQMPGGYDQDLRFGSANLKSAVWLVKFLEDVGYHGSRRFDAHAYRTEDDKGVKGFARGCMRTYLLLKEKARQ